MTALGRAAAAAFLRRRLRYQHLRAAAQRALREVSDDASRQLCLEFDDASIAPAAGWLADYAAEIGVTPERADAAPAVPRMNVVVLIVGSRGDVQPFIPIGRRVAQRHRVRIATHAEFRPLVEASGLEFYPLAGDPRQLMEYMVRTGGRIVPTHLREIVEDVPKKRALMAAILESTWRACTERDPERSDARPFVADAIIANPPSFGHIHCAEALGVPLHMVFTMPWTPTAAFPHPFTRLPQGALHPVKNFLSYLAADSLLWAGIGDLINAFREQTLGLAPIGLDEGASILNDNEVPFTYLWPASLVPKPAEWGPHIDLANFIFDERAAGYEPPRDLADFLAAGDPPVYVGFGSCVVEDPVAVTRTIFAALAQAGARGIVSRGSAGLGADAVPPDVHLIGDCPHDWLFPRCRAVCHHGGAGTTAAGLRAGQPTVIVPFFGDQFFWGQVVADAGAGPQPIPIERLGVDALAEAFAFCGRPEARARARELGARIAAVDGVGLVAESLHRHFPVAAMQCAGDGEHLASVYCEPCGLRLCEACRAADHADHTCAPYRYVDWRAHYPGKPSGQVASLVADLAGALREGIGAELRYFLAPHRGGLIIGDEDERDEGISDLPVRRHRSRFKHVAAR